MRRLRSHLIPSTVPARHLREQDVGGKALHLFHLEEHGFPVPPWFVVTCRVFAERLNGTRAKIEGCIRGIDFGSRKSVAAASHHITEMIGQLSLPDRLLLEICDLARTLSENDRGVSVRSSAVGEDSQENSFAGQLESFLNVHSDGVAEAIKSVWASAFSERALVYRQKKGLRVGGAPTAVIVQRMVDSRVSGVAFSRDPASGERECVITAGLGWGEGIVNDTVAADTYRIGWREDAVRRQIASKQTQIVAASSGSRLGTVPVAQQNRPALADEQVRRVRDAAIRAEHCFGGPQDLEWGIDETDRLFILQTRPITSGPQNHLSTRSRIWDNANIIESYPGLTLPLTFSFIRDGYRSTFRAAAAGLVLFKREMRKHEPVFANMIGLIRGRVYYNLFNWYTMLSFLPGVRANRKSWDQMIGIQQKTARARGRLSWINRVAAGLSMLYRLLAVGRTARQFFAVFDTIYHKYQAVDFDALSAEESADLHDALSREFSSVWHLTLYNDFSAMKYYDWLKRLCNHEGLRAHPSLHNDLLCGRDDVESVAPVASLVELARLFTANAQYAELLKGTDDQDTWRRISDDRRFTVLKRALAVHIDRFGDRGLEELKLDSPTLRENPAQLIARIREWSRLDLSPEDVKEREHGIRHRAAATLKEQLRNPLRRVAVHFVLRQARRAISNRENMRFARSRVYGLVRRLFIRLGDLLAREGLLDAKSDVHYLTVNEVLGFVRGTNVTHNARALVALRRADYEDFANQSIAARFETAGLPCLDHVSGDSQSHNDSHELTGIGCSSGTVQGTARIVDDPQEVHPDDDAILIADSTDPGWVFLMVASKGIVVERGSVLSHTAIIGRELGIPTIVGAVGARRLIPNGARIRIDGGTGVVRWN